MGDKQRDTLSVREVADLLGVTYITALKYIHKGMLDAVQVGGQWKIKREEYERFTTQGNFQVSGNLEEIEVEEEQQAKGEAE